MPGYIPIVTLLMMTQFSSSNTTLESIALKTVAAHAIAYPFMTAQRRMEAQIKGKPGMLHPRYSNYASCMYHIFREEGIRGYFRGFPVYLMAAAITFGFVPLAANALLETSILYGNKKGTRSDNQELYDEVAEGRERLLK